MPESITSVKNPRVKDAVKLRGRRGRQKQQRIIIDGARELLRAMDAGVELVEVFVCPPLCESRDARRVVERLETFSAEALHVPVDVMEKLAFGERSEGVVGVATPPRHRLDDLPIPNDGLVAVLAGVEKPGNVGAVVRSADGAGVTALIVADGATDLYNPNAIRASLGTIFSLPVAVATSEATLAWLRERNVNVFAARVDGAVDYAEADYTRPAAMVLGSETDGLSDIWHTDDVTGIRLPMHGVADSLNVSAAAAVLFYEAQRQAEK